MSWYVFTEDELRELINGNHVGLAESLQARGEWTENDTLLVKARGVESTILVGCYSKYPRRMARDPPTDTRPTGTVE